MTAAEPREPALRVLGSLTLSSAGADAVLARSPRLRRVLAALAVRAGQVLSADLLAEVAWGDRQPPTAKAALHNLLSRLRGLLSEVDGLELLTRPPGYLLQAGPSTVDVAVFEELVAAGDHTGALALWRGPAYAEFAGEPYFRGEVARLEALREQAEADWLDELLATGSAGAAVARLELVVAAQPLRERPRAQLMLALYRSGRVGEALAHYRGYRALLAGELGIEPSAELSELHRDLLRQEVQLDAPVVAQTPADGQLFVGREGDLREIERLLARQRLLTLVGPGGVGKTRLARQLIERVGRWYPDGVVVVELASVSDEAQVAGVVAAALAGLRVGAGALLHLDNCEHVLPAVAELLRHLLPEHPELRVLATSRERLRVPGEQLWPVEPLSTQDGVRLFSARAAAVDPGFRPPPELAELCRRLDNLPLGIELAAARAGSLSVREILARLDDLPELLAASSGPPRHRSPHAVLDWSYRLLTPQQQEVFDRLSVFADDFSLDAAEALAGPASVLLDLVDCSLVRHVRGGDGSRYALLDTMRRFGRAHLAEQGRLAELQTGHAAWYLALAERLGPSLGAGRSGWIHRLGLELCQLREAHRILLARQDLPGLLRLAEALHHYALYSLEREPYEWSRRLIALAEAPIAYATAADGAWLGGDSGAAVTLARHAIGLSDPDTAPAALLVSMGDALAGSDEGLAAREQWYARAMLAAERAGDEPQRVLAQLRQVSCMIQSGRQAEGARLADLLLVRAQALDSPDLMAKAELIRADAQLTYEPALAVAGYWRAAELNEASGNRYQEYQTTLAAAFAEIMYGDERRSLEAFRTLLTRWTALLHDWPLATVLQGVVILLVEGGRHLEAATLAGAVAPRPLTIAFTVDGQVLARYEIQLGTARLRLGASGFAQALARGRALGPQAAVELALSSLDLIG